MSDKNINLNDPDFWAKVFKDSKTGTKVLLEELESKRNLRYDPKLQQDFMVRLNEQINLLVKNKLHIESYSAEDEFNITEILNKITSTSEFNKQYKDYCFTWLDEIIKPSRRFKRL